MHAQSYSTTVSVDAPPDAVFAAVNDVRSWWSDDVEGGTEHVGDEFTFRVEGIHLSRIRVTEQVPGQVVAWRVLENHMGFVEDQTEWVGTDIRFELAARDGGTDIRFSHVGLLPGFECYDVCSDAWAFYLHDSLPSLLGTGTGKPTRKAQAVA